MGSTHTWCTAPLRCKAIASAQLKVDAATLGQLLADVLPEAWTAPRGVQQLRARV